MPAYEEPPVLPGGSFFKGIAEMAPFAIVLFVSLQSLKRIKVLWPTDQV